MSQNNLFIEGVRLYIYSILMFLKNTFSSVLLNKKPEETDKDVAPLKKKIEEIFINY